MSTRLIRLRYAGRCVQCGSALPAAESGWWSAEEKTVRCQGCGPGPESDPVPPIPQQSVYGVAGGSALAKYVRLEQRRQESIQAERSRIVRIVRNLKGEPQSTTAWGKGAVGEQRVGTYLESLTATGAVVLHDRRMPGSRANIDHIVVSAAGVWVVDSKHYSGRVQLGDRGGWFRTDLRLLVGGRDRTHLARAMAKQVDAVRGAVADTTVPVRPVLCLTGAEWSMFAKPFAIDGVVVTWSRALVEMIQRAERRGVSVAEVAERLAVRLAPAT